MNKNNVKLMYDAFKNVSIAHIVAAVTAMLCIFIDSIVVSRFLGTNAMAGYGFAQPIILIVNSIAMIFCVGTQGIMGKLLGKGDISSINKVVSIVLTINSLISIAIMLIILIFGDYILMAIGAKGEIFKISCIYLKTVSISTICFMLNPLLTGFMQMDNDLPRSYYSIIAMTVCNAIFDILSATVLNIGMLGIGLATTFSNYINLIILLFHFRKKNIMLKLSFSLKYFSYLKEIILIGIPSAMQQACLVIRTSILNVLLFSIAGSIAVASYTILNGNIPIIMSIIRGICISILLVVGAVFGEEDKYTFKYLTKKIFIFSMGLSIIIAMFIFIFANNLTSIFVDKNEIAQFNMAYRVLRLYAFSIPFIMFVNILVNYFQLLKKFILSNIILLFENLIFVIIFSYILQIFFKTDGVWLSFLLSEILTSILIIIYIIIKNKHNVKSVENLLLLPKNFGVLDDKKINITVTNIKGVNEVSSNIIEFCKKNSIDEFKAIYSGICMEEMSVMILNNNQNNTKIKIDVFVMLKNNNLRIRLRDNGIPLDLKKQDEILNPIDKISNVAIRMFYKMSKNITYNNLFGLNILTFYV